MKTATPPVVLALSAHDPSGAAGVQADIESCNANGVVCVSVLTALTAQNTARFDALLPQSPEHFRKQAELLLADIRIDAVKIGLIGSAELVDEIAIVLRRVPGLPVVLDPVLHAGTGTALSTDALLARIRSELLPLTTVVTPNLKEARQLTGVDDRDNAAQVLLERGCRSVLITGADEPTGKVINSLYRPGSAARHDEWERLPGVYHGSGCTLAAAIAAGLARGNDIETAVAGAQHYCWQALKHGYRLGHAQLHPKRHLLERE